MSIPSNLAEGSSRLPDKDKSRFAEIALGSSFELETQILIAQAVSLGDKQLCQDLLEILISEQKMLNAYVKSLNR